MFIKLRNGNSLECAVASTPTPTEFVEVLIISQEGENYMLGGGGITIPVPKAIVKVNNLRVENSRIHVPYSLYKRWFACITQQLNEENTAANSTLFNENFKRIYQNRDLVFSNSKYFLMRLSGLFYCNSFGHSTVSLGGILESWENDSSLIAYSHRYDSTVFIISAWGSIFSGRHTWIGRCEKKQKFIEGQSPRFAPIWHEFQNIDKLYPDNSTIIVASIADLLDEIEQREQKRSDSLKNQTKTK